MNGYKDNNSKENNSKDLEAKIEQEPDNKFPSSIPFIIGNEFCERFCYYGMRGKNNN